jgi:hypothetical protein
MVAYFPARGMSQAVPLPRIAVLPRLSVPDLLAHHVQQSAYEHRLMFESTIEYTQE